MAKNPIELFGKNGAEAASHLVRVLKSEKVSAVRSKVAAHTTVFLAKDEAERARLASQIEALSTQWYDTRTGVKCPSCGNQAMLQGSLERVSRPFYDGEQLLEKVVVRAHRMECPSYGLALIDVDELHIAGIEPHFEYLLETELHTYHEPDEGPEYDNM